MKFRIEAIRLHIKRNHPGCPDFAVEYFAREVHKKNRKNATIGRAVGITMQTVLRHQMTDYDQLLLIGVDHREARRRAGAKVKAIIRKWERP